jgi:hypothetical protein
MLLNAHVLWEHANRYGGAIMWSQTAEYPSAALLWLGFSGRKVSASEYQSLSELHNEIWFCCIIFLDFSILDGWNCISSLSALFSREICPSSAEISNLLFCPLAINLPGNSRLSLRLFSWFSTAIPSPLDAWAVQVSFAHSSLFGPSLQFNNLGTD